MSRAEAAAEMSGRGSVLVKPAGVTWEQRLAEVVATMREMSSQTDPHQVVATFGSRVRRNNAYEGLCSLSRRGLEYPHFRVTRSHTWKEDIDPWKQKERLPLLKGGLFAELLYGDEPRIIDEVKLEGDDPAAPFIDGMRSLQAIPNYDGGKGLNMVCMLMRRPGGFDPEQLPDAFWLSNLFGRATNTLVLAGQLREANEAMDREMRVVAEIQRSLLPTDLPKLPTLELAAYYQTSKNAGGDYYDFFELGEGRLGILIADVSGHGTPAAVLMAILHAIAHLVPGGQADPAKMLSFINGQMATKYTVDSGTFATAFYGVYEASTRRMVYSSAGHNPPLVVSGRTMQTKILDETQSLPLGVLADTKFTNATVTLETGDTLVMYTDGITEAHGPGRRMYGETRLGAAVACCPMRAGPTGSAQGQLQAILDDVEAFAQGVAAADDRTMIVAKVR